MQYIGKILPVDGYRVQVIDSLPVDYDASLVHLYQPLIGIEAISLYKLLLTEASIQNGTNYQTHHTLMNYLTISLNKIYEARLKLEGIGLLKTYEYKEDDKTVYTYVLQAPFRPTYFFQDMMLSELLYRHIGKVKYEALQGFYLKQSVKTNGKEVTASFKDVFQTFTPKHNSIPVQQTEAKTNIPLPKVDFESISFMLQRKNVRTTDVLTERNKELMTQLIHLYELELYELEQAINWALTEENKIDISQLKQACHDLFQTKHNVVNVQLAPKQTENNIQQPPTKPLSKTDQLIERFETISPKELLEDLSTGNNATSHEMRMISDVMTEQALPAPVMNVLIHYVMLQSNHKLPRRYFESIAASWSRHGFKTAREALEFSMSEIQQPTKQRQKKYTNYNKYQGKEEVIPDWFKERDKQEETQTAPLTEAEQQEQADLLEALQRHATKNN